MQKMHDITVLGIDDDPGALMVLKSVSDGEGFNFHSAKNGIDALRLLQTIEPDVIITDVMMPKMDGYALVGEIKKIPKLKNIPIIMITALNDRVSKIRSIECGCDDFLTKPFSRQEAIARIRSLARSKRLADEMESIDAVLLSLARSVESKDVGIKDHIDSLIKLAEKFGEYLGLSACEMKTLARGCVLHDIGKISVPEAVLLKAGPLNEKEWALMKQHPAVGATILGPMKSLQKVIPIVKHHHERWDGTGYPDGLSGEESPKLVRIFQILDAFDALTRDRVYKKALSYDRALEVLLEEASSGRWDPNLINVFVRFVRETEKDLLDSRLNEKIEI